jgi:hypothetical protein
VDTTAMQEATVDTEHAIKTMETRSSTTPSRTSSLEHLGLMDLQMPSVDRMAISKESKDSMVVERREATAEGWEAMDMSMLMLPPWTLKLPWRLMLTLLLLRSADSRYDATRFLTHVQGGYGGYGMGYGGKKGIRRGKKGGYGGKKGGYGGGYGYLEEIA